MAPGIFGAARRVLFGLHRSGAVPSRRLVAPEAWKRGASSKVIVSVSLTTPAADDKKNRKMWLDECRVFTDVEIGTAADFVRKRVVGQNGDLIDAADFQWARDEDVTEWIDQLPPLYEEARAFDFEEASSSVVVSGEKFVHRKVVNLGEDVLALGMTVGIDKDSRRSAVKAIFLRREQRDAARVAVETVFLKEKVCLTGSPGCGKTFATVPAIIAETLLRGLPVLHVSKDLEMQFFMPDGDGGVAAWTVETPGRSWIESDLANDPRIVVVYDPPNEPLGIKITNFLGRCIMVPSDNRLKYYAHLNNLYGAVLYKNPATTPELRVICPQVWSANSQKAGEPLLTGADLIKEIELRIRLVGPLLRYIVNWDLFLLRVIEIRLKVSEVMRDVGDLGLIENELSMESGKLQTTWVDYSRTSDLDPEWRRRLYSLPEFMPLAVYLMRSQRPNILDSIRARFTGSVLGGLFEPVCGQLVAQGGELKAAKLEPTNKGSNQETKSKALNPAVPTTLTLRRRNLIHMDTAAKKDAEYEALKRLEDGELLCMSQGFPLFDFAASPTEWYNSRSARSRSSINCITGLNVLLKLGVVEIVVDSGKFATVALQESFKATLYIVDYATSFSSMTLQGSAAERALFLKHVDLYKLSVAGTAAIEQLDSTVELALERFDFFDYITKSPPKNVE